MASKSAIRQNLVELTAFDGGQLAEKSRLICREILAQPEWQQARTVATFAQHRQEPDLEELFTHAAGKALCFPVVRASAMDFFAVDDPRELEVGRWNLRQPIPGKHRAVLLEEIDLILVPGIAFSPQGERLGRGGGYYDRLLADARLHAARFGVCFAIQILPRLPAELHDMRVDRVICEPS